MRRLTLREHFSESTPAMYAGIYIYVWVNRASIRAVGANDQARLDLLLEVGGEESAA